MKLKEEEGEAKAINEIFSRRMQIMFILIYKSSYMFRPFNKFL